MWHSWTVTAYAQHQADMEHSNRHYCGEKTARGYVVILIADVLLGAFRTTLRQLQLLWLVIRNLARRMSGGDARTTAHTMTPHVTHHAVNSHPDVRPGGTPGRLHTLSGWGCRRAPQTSGSVPPRQISGTVPPRVPNKSGWGQLDARLVAAAIVHCELLFLLQQVICIQRLPNGVNRCVVLQSV